MRASASAALRTHSWLVLLAAALLSPVLTGCMVGPKYHPPVTQPPAAFKETPAANPQDGTWTVAQPQDAKLRGNWWEIFGDSELNALEDQLNINNQNIKEYFENYMESRALITQARSQFFPTLTTDPSYSRSRSSSNLTNASTSNNGAQSSIFDVPLDLSWEPDLWGRIRNTVRAAQYTAQVSAADLENERLTEQATLAETFFEIHGQDALGALYAQTVTADQKAYNYAQVQYDTGVGDRIAAAEAQSTLLSAESAETNLLVLRAQYEHAIAVLIGKQASVFSIPVRPITTAPPPIPIGLPSELLERRPDVAAAERTMAIANAEIRIAYSAYYPSFTLSATGGLEASTFKKLFDLPSRTWSIGPSFPEDLYVDGLLSGAIHQYVAVYNSDLAAYRQTVLTAFQQVEDYLAQTRILSRQIQQQRQVVDAAQRSLNLEMFRYTTGVDPFIDVATLQTTLIGDQQSLVSLQIEQMTGAVELIEALGGGWDKSQLPTPSEVTKKAPKSETSIQQ